MEKEFERKLKIRTNVLKRCLKELEMYKTEVVSGEQKLQMMEQTHDKYRQLSQVLEESRSMILDSSDRLKDATMQYQELLASENIPENVKSEDLFSQGTLLMDKAKKIINGTM